MDVIPAPTSGRIYTDSLVKGPIWASPALSFSFPSLAAEFTGYAGGEPSDNFEGFNDVQKAAARAILGSIATFANLSFSERTGAAIPGAVLRFGMTDDVTANSIAHAYLPAATEKGGDSWYRNTDDENDSPLRGNYAWHTLLHEIGHTLGLGHPHEPGAGEAAMPADRDAMSYTVMSYRSVVGDGIGYHNEEWSFAQTYMMEDIAALQFLYGANFNHNGTDSVYRWDPATGEMSINGAGQGAPGGNRIFLTVWDGGGTDTYDLSNHNVATSTIDLRPGEWSLFSVGQQADLGGGDHPPGNVANALLFNGDTRSLIENAIGTNGDDTIHGNDIANRLSGLAGDDALRGLAGNDILLAGSGSDLLDGGAGSDVLYFGSDFGSGDGADGGADRDALVLQGNYTYTFGAGQLANLESISLQSGSVTKYGQSGANSYDYDLATHDANLAAGLQMIVNGQSLLAGEDFRFNGAAETDGRFLVYAGRGTDTLTGGGGTDLFHFEGNRFGAGDTVSGGAGMDAIMLSMGSGFNRVEFGESQFSGIESISVNNRYATDPSQVPSYELVLRNGNVTPGGNLIVNGQSLAAGQTIGVDGSAVTGGTLTIYGGAGSDTLTGGGRGDLIHGADGLDVLTGGGGADTFQYRATSASAPGAEDRILDFQVGTDKIDLGFVDANSLVAGDSAFAFIGSAAFSVGNVGELRAELVGGYWHIKGETNGDGVADFVIYLTALNADPITSSDFIL